jgi:hypothetical protein
VIAQAGEAVRPMRADPLHPRERVAERLRRQPVARLAPCAARLDEARAAERGEVLLRDRLPRHGSCRRELGQRRRLAAGERLEQMPAARVRQR